MSDHVFSIVPIDACADPRLTLEQFRVLVALLSFRAKNTDCVWPKRKQISERCGGMNMCNISTATTALESLGWLEKLGEGGRSRACRYRITVPDLTPVTASVGGRGAPPAAPETVADQATVAWSATVADQATVPVTEPLPIRQPFDGKTVAYSATKTVADSATGIEQTNEQTNKKKIERVGACAPDAPSGGRRKRREDDAASPRQAPVTFDTFAARCRAVGEKLICDHDPILAYAESAGIPEDWLRMAWIEFKARYVGNAKRYTDWRATFRNAVRGNWFKLWRADNSGTLVLTTEGITAHRAMSADDRRGGSHQQGATA